MFSWDVFSKRRGAVLFGLLGLLAFGLMIYLSAPGYMSADSGDQLEQARSFQLRDDNPVVMALIWRYVDMLIPGPFGMLLLMNGLYWGGLAVVFWSLDGPLLARALGLIAVGFYPPTVANMPVIWKDSLMQSALIAALACLMVPTPRFRVARYGAAIVFFVIGIGARHNAAAGVWPLLALPMLQLPFLLGRARWLRLLAASALSLAVTLGLTVGVDRALSPLAKRTEFWQMIPVFDLAGMSLQAGKVLVEPESGVLTPGMGLSQIRRLYQTNYVNKLYYCLPFRGKRCVPLFRQTLDRERLAALSDNWLRAIRAHPLAYFEHRRALVKNLLNIKDGPPGTFYVQGAPHHPMAAQYPVKPHTIEIFNWIDSQFRSGWFRTWIYMLVGCIGLPVALIGYLRGASALPLMLLLSGVSYMLGLFVSTGSAGYRYTVWSMFCVVLAIAVSALPAVKRRSVRAADSRLTDAPAGSLHA
jgi:hypothetical protein